MMQGPRPQSRGRPGTEMFNGPNQSDSSILMSPPNVANNTTAAGAAGNMNFVPG